MKPENWIKWDLDSRGGFKMASFVAEHGAKGYGAFVMLVEMLYRAEDNKLPLYTNGYNPYTKLFKVEQTELDAYIGDLVELGLFQKDDKSFWSIRVVRELEGKKAREEEISEKRKLAISNRWGKKGIQTDTNGIQNDTNDTRGEKRREEERRGEVNILTNPTGKKVKYRTFNPEDFKFPPLFGNQARAAVEKWVRYKETAGHAKLLLSYQQEIDDHADRPKDYVAYVNRAISNNWQGFNQKIPLESTTGQKANKGEWKSISEKQVEKNVEILNQIREREKEEEQQNETR